MMFGRLLVAMCSPSLPVVGGRILACARPSLHRQWTSRLAAACRGPSVAIRAGCGCCTWHELCPIPAGPPAGEEQAMVMQDAQQRPTTPSPEPAAPAVERPLRSLGARAAGPNRYISVAGALALTEPGPAAAGLVVADRQGRVLAQRAHYLGQSTRAEAAAQALLTAARLALASGLEAPVFRTDDHALYDALTASPQAAPADAIGKGVLAAIREVLAQLPGSRVELIPPSANEARAVALAPLVDWLP